MKIDQTKARRLERPSRAWLALSAGLMAAGVAFLAAFGVAQYQYGRSSRYYAALRGNVTANAQAAGETQAADAGIDFATLRAVNPDAAAWLEMPGLDLSLPVVQAQDNETYLHRAFDGSDSPAGCLFFAAPTGGDAALYRVIYGHNLHDGSMFSGLLRYADEAFYREHPTFTLYTPEETQTWRIFSAHTATDATGLYRTGRTPGEDYDAFVQDLQAMSEYDTGAAVPPGAQVLTLSTCQSPYASGPDRFVVHAYREGGE